MTRANTQTGNSSNSRIYGLNSEFDGLVHRLVEVFSRDQLTELKRDFHTRLRITQAHPERAELVEDLWDYFYDWCIFDRPLGDVEGRLEDSDRKRWEGLKAVGVRGIFIVQKIGDTMVKLKELYSGKAAQVVIASPTDFLGISRGDLVECRLILNPTKKEEEYWLARRPSYHPTEVHNYIKKKVRQFKKVQDFSSYQAWLWLLVGMYLKHRIYSHMPIDKIYDDNSRI